MTLERRNSFSRIRKGKHTYVNLSDPCLALPQDSPKLDDPEQPDVDKPNSEAKPALVRRASFGRIRKCNIDTKPASSAEPDAGSAKRPAETTTVVAAAPAAPDAGGTVRAPVAADAEATEEVYEDDFEELEEEEWVPLDEVEAQIRAAVAEERARVNAELCLLRAQLEAADDSDAAQRAAERTRAEHTVRIVRAVREAAAAELAAAVGCARKAALAEAARVDALRDELAAARATAVAECARADALRAELDALSAVHVRSADALRALGIVNTDGPAGCCALCGDLGVCGAQLHSPLTMRPARVTVGEWHDRDEDAHTPSPRAGR